MTDNVATASKDLRKLARERVELQALFDAGTDTTADINRVMVLNKAMDEAFPGLVQELVELREWATQAREALECAYKWDLHRQSCGRCRNSRESADVLCDAGFKLYGDTLRLRNKALAAMPGGSDG